MEQRDAKIIGRKTDISRKRHKELTKWPVIWARWYESDEYFIPEEHMIRSRLLISDVGFSVPDQQKADERINTQH